MPVWVVLDGAVTPELRGRGGWAKDRIRELQVNWAQEHRAGRLGPGRGADVGAGRRQRQGTVGLHHRDLIAGEILATSFEFVGPDALPDGSDIGDGVRVSIVRA